MEDTDAEARACLGVVCYFQFMLDEMSQQFRGNYSGTFYYMMHSYSVFKEELCVIVFHIWGCLGECFF